MKAAFVVAWLASGAALIAAAGCGGSEPNYPAVTSLRSLRPTAIGPLPDTRPTPPAPPPPQAAEQKLSGHDFGYGEKELPALLGNLWYPGANLSACSHSRREGGTWPAVTLTMPANERPRDIINYYQVRYPEGERTGDSEFIFQTERVGDKRAVTVRLLRAKSGTEATRFIARIGG